MLLVLLANAMFALDASNFDISSGSPCLLNSSAETPPCVLYFDDLSDLMVPVEIGSLVDHFFFLVSVVYFCLWALVTIIVKLVIRFSG